MSDPTPLGRGLAALIPGAVRIASLAEEDLAPIADDPYLLGESPAEAAERARKARASRRRMWADRVPVRFREARVATLETGQDPDGRVSGWWASESAVLVLYSTRPGLGKSHTAYAVGNHAAANGAWAAGWSMVDLNDAIRPGNDPTAYQVACEADLLLIDDLGREVVSPWTLERLQGVMDRRWREGKRTIVTTNLTGEKLVARYGDPIVDRIIDGMTFVEVTGEPRRRAMPW